MAKKFKTEFFPVERSQLRNQLDRLTRTKAIALGYTEEVVVQEIRYWQQSAAKGHTNPTKTQKQNSFRHWNGLCSGCGTKIESIGKAVFHHLSRGVRSLHSPENMHPFHRDEVP
ncbi:MAG: hypothetical protein M3Z35_07895 [Nitrospirota bacterium]|nr:hypothetical protein [Nitrospirota bacterium]